MRWMAAAGLDWLLRAGGWGQKNTAATAKTIQIWKTNTLGRSVPWSQRPKVQSSIFIE
jgi:hypothetical protein